MQPGTPGRPGSEVVWHRCDPATAPTPPPTAPIRPDEPYPPTSTTGPEASQAAIRPAAPQDGEGQSQRCRRIGEFFAAAAQMRDNGIEPQVAEEELVWRVNSQTPEITIERIRETVELVYFDQEYRQMQGEYLTQRVNDRCVSGRGPYAHPLP